MIMWKCKRATYQRDESAESEFAASLGFMAPYREFQLII